MLVRRRRGRRRRRRLAGAALLGLLAAGLAGLLVPGLVLLAVPVLGLVLVAVLWRTNKMIDSVQFRPKNSINSPIKTRKSHFQLMASSLETTTTLEISWTFSCSQFNTRIIKEEIQDDIKVVGFTFSLRGDSPPPGAGAS